MSQDPHTTILNILQFARDLGLDDALYGDELVRAVRTTERALTDDGRLTSLGRSSLPEQSFHVIVPPSTSPGVLDPRFPIPSASQIVRIVAIATGNASATFSFDLRVNGVRASGGSGSIRVGTSQGGGTTSVNVPAGSVISVETKSSIAQAVTVTVFYRPVEE